MKKIITIIAIALTTTAFAQVGIGNTDPKGTLDVNKTSYLPNEQAGIAVTQQTAAQIVAMTTTDLKAGTLVYATDTNVTINSVGYWNWNGTAWEKLSGNNIYNNDGTLLGARTLAQGSNNLTFDGAGNFIKTGGNVGIGTNAPNAKLDIRTNPTSISDPGAGFFGLGTTTANADAAGAGAVRYNNTSGGILQYSNGVVWNTLQSTVQKTLVVASKWTQTQTLPNNAVTQITNWTEDTDNSNSYDPTTGVFTAPRTGVYTISATLGFESATNYAGTLQTQIVASSGRIYKSSVPANSNGGVNIIPGPAVSISILLNANETVTIQSFQSTGASRNLLVDTGGQPNLLGFNNFSVIEN